MKTVKRKAEVGERVVKVRGLFQGTRGKVEDVTEYGVAIRLDGRALRHLTFHDSYEVIIEDEPLERLKPNRIGKDGSVAMPDRVHPKLTTERRDGLDYGGPMGAPIPPHSAHYHQTGIDPLEVMRQAFPAEQYEGFLRGNALKYIMRYPLKGTPVEDLEKAKYYVDKLLGLLERTKVTIKDESGNVVEEFYEEGVE